jgi:hypothetical protein
LTKEPKKQWRKDSPFNKCSWENCISMCKRLKLDPCLLLFANINLTWIKDLNIKSETLKQLWKVVGNILEHAGISNSLLNVIPMLEKLRERMNKCDCIKVKSFCTAKRNSC